MEKIRALRADEIECRVASVGKNGCQLLLYKNSRCDKRILDETFGYMNWQDKYREIDGVLFCSVGVRNETTGEWIWKEDCGIESFSDKEKGEASDAFKRACFNWGIGRELYTKLFLWANVPVKKDDEASKKANRDIYKLDNNSGTWSFNVVKIDTDNENEKIKSIVIEGVSSKGEKVIVNHPVSNQGTKGQKKKDVLPDITTMVVYLTKAYQGENLEKLLTTYNVEKISDISTVKIAELYKACVDRAKVK